MNVQLTKIKHKTISVIVCIVTTVCSFLFASAQTIPQSTTQNYHLAQSMIPQQLPTGEWVMPASANRNQRSASSQLTTGGPDEYGYTWDNTVPLAWIDATGGTDSGLSGDSWGQRTVPLTLPFSFKFYENSYSQIIIGASGYLGFSDEGNWPGQPRLPSPQRPNNLIAPYASPFQLATAGTTSRVYYLSGGSAPNRYFVVEWFQVATRSIGQVFTFEAVLHENGDVYFQYLDMTYGDYGWSCGTAALEDATGFDGLISSEFCARVSSNHAVRYTRPAASARVRVTPPYQGQFSSPGRIIDFRLPIRNTGDFGADTFDLTVSSAWPVTLLAPDGNAPLTDTDGDSIIDTGSLPQATTTEIVARLQTPADAANGAYNTVEIQAKSSIDTGRGKTGRLQTTVPVPFVQVYNDDSDGAMSIFFAQPAGHLLRKGSADSEYGNDPVIAEMLDGNFIYFWNRSRRTPNGYSVSEIKYSIFDKYGNVLRSPSRLINLGNVSQDTYDSSLQIAVAPNGNIGLIWQRVVYDGNNRYNYNAFFAILDPNGVLIYGPENVSQNPIFGNFDDFNMPLIFSGNLVATTNNRFMLAWGHQYYEPPSDSCTQYCQVADVYFAIRSSSGVSVAGPNKFTNSAPRVVQFYQPSLGALQNDQAILLYTNNSTGGIDYAILDSNGETIKAPVSFAKDNYTFYARGSISAKELTNGKTIIVWESSDNSSIESIIRHTLLDANHNLVSEPTHFDNPAAVRGEARPSITLDPPGNPIITWSDDYGAGYRNLYYAVLDTNGVQLTPPMVSRSAAIPGNEIHVNYRGGSSASYHWVPPAGVDAVANSPAQLVGAAPGGNASVVINFANYGATPWNDAQLSVEMDSQLQYVNDDSGITAVVEGNKVSWHLPQAYLFDQKKFAVVVSLPETLQQSRQASAFGDRYPLTITLSTSDPDANPNDNTSMVEVMAAHQVFLPVISASE